MATLQVRLDNELKTKADNLFSSLEMDTSTAIRIFLTSAVENNGLPFPVKHLQYDYSLEKAIFDSRHQSNLYGPFNTTQDAIKSMLED